MAASAVWFLENLRFLECYFPVFYVCYFLKPNIKLQEKQFYQIYHLKEAILTQILRTIEDIHTISNREILG